MNQFIGIEGGGTKFICGHGSNPHDLQDRTVIQTTSPEKTLHEVIEYIHSVRKKSVIKAIGVAIFGPLDLERTSPTYGHITAVAKLGWGNVDIVGILKKHFNLPIGFDTDVNGAAMGEHRWGAARGFDDFLYLTVGTGIGGGMMMHGKLVHGAMHPEMGHIFIPQTSDDTYKGACHYHKHCLEGLASGTAMSQRWNVSSALSLPPDHIAWDLEAHYLGLGLANYVMTLAPKRIVIGGGVMQQTHLLPKIRTAVLKSLNSYFQCKKVIEQIDDYIVTPGLNQNAGLCGAIALAEQAYQARGARQVYEQEREAVIA